MKEEAVRFAERAGIRLHIARSDGDAPGTIVLEEPTHAEPPVVGLSLLDGLLAVSCPATEQASACAALASETTNAVLTILTCDGLTAIVHAPPDHQVGEDEEPPMRSIGQAARSAARRRAAVVCAVGREAGSPATLQRLTSMLRESGIEIIAAVSGGRSVKVVVPGEQSRTAIDIAHALLIRE